MLVRVVYVLVLLASMAWRSLTRIALEHDVRVILSARVGANPFDRGPHRPCRRLVLDLVTDGPAQEGGSEGALR